MDKQEPEQLGRETFSSRLQRSLRSSGYSQKTLAEAIGLHPKVLGRKLNGRSNAYLTHSEVRSIVLLLAQWHAITTKDEVLQLLEALQMNQNIFTSDEWQRAPLSTLLSKSAAPSNPPAPLPASVSGRHNLPALTTRLIGREEVLTQLLPLLRRDTVRLVTFIGPGGCGKTRLALEVARQLIGTFAHGIWFVPLAEVSDPEQVTTQILKALNVESVLYETPLRTLISYVREKQLLLVLDNCEHLQPAATTHPISEMLASAPKLKILTTSRVRLHLYGEYEFNVPSLNFPPPETRPDKGALAKYSAVQLFVERAQALLPDFILNDENAAIIARICARVDGLPIALELAAARVKILPLPLLLEKLSYARLHILTGGAKDMPERQQTLRNTIRWSYNLLSLPEQALFRRLGIFTESCSLEAIEALVRTVTEDEEHPITLTSLLDLLECLVNNSLLLRVPTIESQARFAMLETLREYALEELQAHNEFEKLQDWHACYYLGAAEAARTYLRSQQPSEHSSQLIAESGNFLAAVEWTYQRAGDGMNIPFFPSLFLRDGDDRTGGRPLSPQDAPLHELPAIEMLLNFTAILQPYWEWRGCLTEGRFWLAEALRFSIQDTSSPGTLAAYARALSAAARLAYLENDQAQAVEMAEKSIALWKKLNNTRELAIAFLHRGWSAHALAEYEQAKTFYKESLQYLSPATDTWLYARVLLYQGMVAGLTSDFEHMRACYTQSRELFEQIGKQRAIVDMLKDQGCMLVLEGKYREAIDHLCKSIERSYEDDDTSFLAIALGLLGVAFGMVEKNGPVSTCTHAVQLGGAAHNLAHAIGLSPWITHSPLAQALYQRIGSRVDEETLKTAWEAGMALTVEQAMNLARTWREEISQGQ